MIWLLVNSSINNNKFVAECSLQIHRNEERIKKFNMQFTIDCANSEKCHIQIRSQHFIAGVKF